MSDEPNPRPPEAARLARVFPDHPLRETRLDFEAEGFARTLAELAWNPENATPFTVVVRGGWGRGKTTLLRRAQWMLEHPEKLDAAPPEGVRKVRTLWFNAWKYPDDDTVLAGLLGEALDALATSEDKLDQLKKLVASYGSGTLRALLALAAPAQLRDLIIEGVADRYLPVREKRAFHDTFRRLFNEVSRLMFDVTPAFRDTGGLSEEQLWTPEAQKREVLVVFLDDLDRCRRERVVEVIEAINLFLDLPGVCFFLGMDWERLVEVLPETVKGQADQFLEKVVQVAFDLPDVSPPGAQEYVSKLLAGSDLAAVLGGEGDLADGDVPIVAAALETRHPRHVKRFLNDLSISLAVLRNTGKLGEGPDRLPERAVVAWHLLSEVLPAARWRDVRALPQNLMDFLRTMDRLEKAGAEAPESGEELEHHAEWRRVEARGLSERHLRVLRELSDDQRHLLVYLATPPAVEVLKERRGEGRLDLFDLGSAAWVEIPGGSFWMGAQKNPDAPGFDPDARDNEAPVRRVTVSPFRLARHPVTNADYAVFAREAGKQPPDHWREGVVPEGKERHPVVNVSWTDATAFCTWFTRRMKAANEGQDLVFRLPREAEWEYAARGADGRRYAWGDGEPTQEHANFGSIVGDTMRVGAYPAGATPEGVLDLAGNVWEWCEDWLGRYPEEDETDPTGPKSGRPRVLRGGSFRGDPRYLRAAYRFVTVPEYRDGLVGFRLLWSSSGGLGP